MLTCFLCVPLRLHMLTCCCCPALFSYVPTDFFETSATLITFILLG